MKTLLITGAGGFLGNKITELAKEKYEIYAIYHNKYNEKLADETCKFLQIDIINQNEFAKLDKITLDYVIHCAALTNVDYCETHQKEAFDANVEGTKNIVKICEKTGAKLIYISTDYVFDGVKQEPYEETDMPNPVNYYAKTKLEGEKLAAEVKNYVVARIAVPYGWSLNHQKANFAQWLVNQLKNKTKVNIVTDQYSNATFVNNAAENILALTKEEFNGIYHITGKECANRYEFARKVAHTFGLDDVLINPCTSSEFKQAAKRPMHLACSTAKAESAGLKLLNLCEGLEKMKKQEQNAI